MKVVISGSFRKHLEEIIELRRTLIDDGIVVLKPMDIDKIENEENPEFVKFEGEEAKSEEELQEEYDLAISHSDAHIIFNKDGYIGDSVARELCMGAGNNALSIMEMDNGIGNQKYSQVYLLEPIDELKISGDFVIFIKALIMKGNIKVGIDQLYQDFEIRRAKTP